jgi:bacteriorhodopsin
MAEINIEKKKKSMWPWLILLLVIIALIVWALYEMTNEPDEVEYREAPATGMMIPADAPLAPSALTQV